MVFIYVEMIILSKKELALSLAKNKEWVISNGIGGYSASTVLGLNTRKKHGLLISSLKSTFTNTLVLSKFEEEIFIGKKKYHLSVNKFPGRYYPNGHLYLEGFVFDAYPSFNYRVNGVNIIKSICMAHGYNAVVVSYKFDSDKDFKFIVKSFVNSRGLDKNTHDVDWVFDQKASRRHTIIKPDYLGAPMILMGSDRADYRVKGFWLDNMEYEIDKENGEDYYDNHFCPGEFVADIKKGRSSLNILVVADGVDEALNIFDNLYSLDPREYEKFFSMEKNRIKSLIKSSYDFLSIKSDKILPYLIQSLDSFILNNTKFESKFIISGYFDIYQNIRNALIGLPGLLAIGRVNDARDLLLEYSRNIKNGLIPKRALVNMDYDYKSVDTSLWFIYACYKFYKYTNNLDFIRINLWGRIKQIVDNYRHRVLDLGFRMDSDGLLHSDDLSHLTWMESLDRKCKLVEVNALWYNALKITELFAKRFNEDFERYLVLSNLVRDSFEKKFWNYRDKCLFESIEENDYSFRATQVLVVGLPFRILDIRKEYLVVKKTTEELLTKHGIRTLSFKDKNYVGLYSGDLQERKKSLFNGVSHTWLLGFYIKAYLRVHNYSEEGKKEAFDKILKEVIDSLVNYGIGSIAELSDSDKYAFKIIIAC
ncbi:glycogen debranching enzyme N-terminal domain-containing protein [Candidatus Woesearchaeota archaeon]|nr:glycogen debranching enzyme N-terminal domain-containing protein [Candidatus Woesearchaeota archaeon]